MLMVERNPNSKSFAGAYVFPGGVYDTRQDTSNQLTAIRETFEETGILLATPDAKSPHQLPSIKELETARLDIHAQRVSFIESLRALNLSPSVDALLPFTEWITPPTSPRRFHAHFFVAFLSTLKTWCDASTGEAVQQLPTPDGGIEVISVRFIAPKDAISEFMAKRIFLMPPQYYLLDTLASLLPGDINTADQRETIRKLALGSFGQRVFNPRLQKSTGSLEHMVLTYEGDESRDGPPGARHRSIVERGQGEMRVIQLERNIDVYGGPGPGLRIGNKL